MCLLGCLSFYVAKCVPVRDPCRVVPSFVWLGWVGQCDAHAGVAKRRTTAGTPRLQQCAGDVVCTILSRCGALLLRRQASGRKSTSASSISSNAPSKAGTRVASTRKGTKSCGTWPLARTPRRLKSVAHMAYVRWRACAQLLC